jgi:hypothetical protein
MLDPIGIDDPDNLDRYVNITPASTLDTIDLARGLLEHGPTTDEDVVNERLAAIEKALRVTEAELAALGDDFDPEGDQLELAVERRTHDLWVLLFKRLGTRRAPISDAMFDELFPFNKLVWFIRPRFPELAQTLRTFVRLCEREELAIATRIVGQDLVDAIHACQERHQALVDSGHWPKFEGSGLAKARDELRFRIGRYTNYVFAAAGIGMPDEDDDDDPRQAMYRAALVPLDELYARIEAGEA